MEGRSPKGISEATSGLRIHPYLLVIPTGSTSSRKPSRDIPESPLTQLRRVSDFVKAINVVVEQHKSDLLKVSCLGANQAKENVGSKLEAAKAELARLKKKLVEDRERKLLILRRCCKTRRHSKSCAMSGGFMQRTTRVGLRRKRVRWRSACLRQRNIGTRRRSV